MKTVFYVSIPKWIAFAIIASVLTLSYPLHASESNSEHLHDMEAMEFDLESLDKPAPHEMTTGHHAFAHPFLVHMGVPDGPGEISVRGKGDRHPHLRQDIFERKAGFEFKFRHLKRYLSVLQVAKHPVQLR